MSEHTQTVEGTKPTRVQQRFQKGWRKPKGAISVSQSTQWGNPVHITEGECNPKGYYVVMVGTGPRSCLYGGYDQRQAHEAAVQWYSDHWATLFDLETVRRELAGHDLMCTCPIGMPCHADVLLELANTSE